jgi:hypothetical protein
MDWKQLLVFIAERWIGFARDMNTAVVLGLRVYSRF